MDKPRIVRAVFDRIGSALSYLLVGALIYLFRLYESTMDIRAWGLENLRLLKRSGERPLVVLWHGKGFLPITYLGGERLCLYASTDRDPNYRGLAKLSRTVTLRMVEQLGYEVMDASQFASESRGVLKYVQALKSGGGAIAADGPGGPIYRAKPGACFLAKKSGVTLLPVGAAMSNGVELDQWDRFEIPSLFSRGAIVVGEPLRVPADCKDEALERFRIEMESALNAVDSRARRLLTEWQAERTTVPRPRTRTEMQ
jgi:lysophospholipid acyltransferase (LPLAT)-like uncharacterized protein